VFRTVGAAALSLVAVAAFGTIVGTGAMLARDGASPAATAVAAPGVELPTQIVDFWVRNDSSQTFELVEKDGDLSERLSPPAGKVLPPGWRQNLVLFKSSPEQSSTVGTAWYDAVPRRAPGIEVRLTSDSSGEELQVAGGVPGVQLQVRGRELTIVDAG
jgi:hypothetical protein